MVPPGPEAWKRLRAPRTYICKLQYWPYFGSIFTVTLFAYKCSLCKKQLCYLLLLFVISWLVSRGVNCSRTAGWIEMPLGKNIRDRKFSLEISGPKVVLLCKFSLYRAVRAPIGPGPWGVSLTSLMDDPALNTHIHTGLVAPRGPLKWSINVYKTPLVGWQEGQHAVYLQRFSSGTRVGSKPLRNWLTWKTAVKTEVVSVSVW